MYFLTGRYRRRIAIPTAGSSPPATLRPPVSHSGIFSTSVFTIFSPKINITKTGNALESPHGINPYQTLRLIAPKSILSIAASTLFAKNTLQNLPNTSRFTIRRPTGTARPIPNSIPFPEVTAKAVPMIAPVI